MVLAPGWSGILLHEAVGHGLEADFIRKKTSLFAGKLGQKVASDKVTVIDDGTVANSRGSINVDDEGNPGEYKMLIENGVLKGYLYDSLNAKLMGQKTTGSGRRESFKHMPAAAHDEHLSRARRRRARGHRPLGEAGAVLRATSAAARWTSRTATSSSR